MAESSEQTNPRRNAGTEFLKECMADALLQLMNAKDFEKITVKEITDTANVGRATYFRHFNSKEEVLGFKICLLWKRWAADHCLETPLPITTENLITCFEFVYSIRSINSLLLKADKLNVLLLALGEELGFTEPKEPYAFYCYCFITYGLSGVLFRWINRDYAQPPKNIIASLAEYALPMQPL